MTIQVPDIESLLTPGRDVKRPTPIAPPGGDEEALKKLEEHFNVEGYTLSISEGSEKKEALSEREKMFLSREGLIRFLIATKGDIPSAITRLEKTIIWRRTENIDDVEAMAADCGPESETGKNILLGFTAESRPIVYFFPTRNTTPPERRRAVHAIFMLERATDLMVDGVTNSMVCFSFAGKRQGPPTSVAVARQTLHILSEYYPEKLYMSHFLDMPWVVKTFINLMWPFVDPATKRKVKFDTDLSKGLDGEAGVGVEGLLKEVGGSMEHDEYWSVLLRVCLERREDQLRRWRAVGEPRVGISETLFKVSPDAGRNLEDDVD